MHISPSRLQEFCVNYICDNLVALCESTPQLNNHADHHYAVEKDIKLEFLNREVYFHPEISEQLLQTLCIKGKLTDYTLSLFDSETTCLR